MQHDLAFLHTAAVHVETFTRLIDELGPRLRVRHEVASELLAVAREDGFSEKLTRRVQAAMTAAASSGARVVVCTCSTIGGLGEATAGAFRAMRIDRPMADLLVEGAWAAFERGDTAGYIAAVANAVRTGRRDADVVVLAQASMAPAAELCGDLGIPVLSSPRIGVETVVQATLS